MTRPIGALITSFMSLLIATFLYATVAGETSGSTRAATLNAMTAVVFAAGLLMMVSGITQILIATRPSVPSGLLKLLVLAVPLTTLAYLDTVTITLVSTLDCEVVGPASVRAAAIAVATIYLATILVWFWWRWDDEPGGIIGWARRPAIQQHFERLVVISIVAIILAAAAVTRLPTDLHLPALAASLAPALMAALLTPYIVGLWSQVAAARSSSRPRRP